jgi:phospholipid/cholesterol/gamma-HCH transport system substrate-binding protein
MLKRERHEIQVGTVFIATLIFLVIALLWAKRYRPQQSQMVIQASFPTVAGLGKGDEVLVAGLRMGIVTDLELRKGDVLVTATLNRRVQMYEGYELRVVALTFTGEMGLLINPGTGAPLREPLPELRGIPPLELSDVVEPGLQTLSSLRTVADTLTWALPVIVRRTSVTLDRLDRVLSEVEQGVTTDRTALRGSLTQLRATLASTGQLVSTLETRLDTSLTAADETFASLKATSDTLRNVLAALDTSGGSLGRLIHEPRLYDEVRKATAHLDSAATSIDSLARDVKRNPRRYLRFSLF